MLYNVVDTILIEVECKTLCRSIIGFSSKWHCILNMRYLSYDYSTSPVGRLIFMLMAVYRRIFIRGGLGTGEPRVMAS